MDGFAEFAADATVIWLKVSAPFVNARLGNVARPLFDGLTEAELAEKIAVRSKIYAEFANYVVDTDNFTPEVIEKIISRLV